MPLQNYADKVKRYFAFSSEEWRSFAITVLVFSFMLSFTQWGTTTFDVQEGLKNWFLAIILVGIVVFVHHAAQRLLGLYYGYRVEQKIWWAGLLVGVLFLLVSNGKVLVFLASAMQAHFLPYQRLGAWRYGASLRQIGMVALVGPVATVAVAFLLYLIAPVKFLADLLTFSWLFAAYCMIPFPPLDGVHVFAGARVLGGSFMYLFPIITVILFFAFYFFAGIGVWGSLFLAFILGLIGWFLTSWYTK